MKNPCNKCICSKDKALCKEYLLYLIGLDFYSVNMYGTLFEKCSIDQQNFILERYER